MLAFLKCRSKMSLKQLKRLEMLSSSTIAPEAKKKRKKKKSEESSSDTVVNMDENPSTEMPVALRPGKKKLRRLNYRQRQLSPVEFLVASMQACTFTRSVVSDLPSDASQTTPNLSNGSKVEVVTSCAIDSSSPSKSSSRKKAEDSIPAVVCRINVQPLIVLDVNGILCHRVRHHQSAKVTKEQLREPITNVAATPVIPRTDLIKFLTFLDSQFCLAVWTSAKLKNAKALIKALFPSSISDRLLFVWAQHNCDRIASEGDADLLYEKNLAKVWEKYPLWHEQNTVLLDDSRDKCQKWHENAIHPPSLHGIKSCEVGKLMMSDENNQLLQQEFFEGLATGLGKQSITSEWTNTVKTSEDVKPFTMVGPPVLLPLLNRLREKAAGHMG